MKRQGCLIEQIADLDNILKASYKAFKGKSCSSEVIAFRNNFFNNINRLRNQLLSGNIEVGMYKMFVVYEPKKRLICAAPLNQRIVHHAIMNVCHEYFDRHLISDSFASRPGKGSHRAILRVKEQARKYNYFAKLDFKKFFDSIDHTSLKVFLMRLFKDVRLLSLLESIIDSYGGDKGLPIGNLTSQYFANFYLSTLDHYMKEIVNVPFYARYMDDVIIMSKNKQDLKSWVVAYDNFANDVLHLQIKPPIIGRVCKGIPFLGYRIFRDAIIMNGNGKRRLKKKYRILNELFDTSRISENEYSRRLRAIFVYPSFANSRDYCSRIIGLMS